MKVIEMYVLYLNNIKAIHHGILISRPLFHPFVNVGQ